MPLFTELPTRSVLGSLVQRCPDDEHVTVEPRGFPPSAHPSEGCSQPGPVILLKGTEVERTLGASSLPL